MRLGQTSAIYFVSKLLASAFGFVATIYFTRFLGEEVIGFYGITLSLVSALLLVGDTGFGGAITKRISEGDELDVYFTAGVIVKIVLLSVVSIGVLVFRETVNAYVGRPVALYILLMMGAHLLLNLTRAALKGNHLVHVAAPLNPLKQAFRSGIMILLVYFGWELSGMLLGHATGTVLVAAIGFWILKPNIAVPSRRHFRKLFDFAKFSWLGGVRKKAFQEADILVLGLFVPSGLTGVYVIAYSLAEFLDIFGRGISTTLFPEISKQSMDGNVEMVRSLTNDALSFAGLILIPGTIGAAILGDRLMRVYGEGFAIGDQVLAILLGALVVYTYNQQLLNTLNAVDRPDLAFRSNSVFIASNVALNLALVYWYGWVGAAVATGLSACIGLVFSFRYTRSQVQFEIPYREMGNQLFAALLMGGFVYGARSVGEGYWIANWNTPFVVGLVGLGAGTYFAVLLLISTQFRTTVLQNLPSRMPFVQ
jgi:O-antigen/teichoic acid export membrane protein